MMGWLHLYSGSLSAWVDESSAWRWMPCDQETLVIDPWTGGLAALTHLFAQPASSFSILCAITIANFHTCRSRFRGGDPAPEIAFIATSNTLFVSRSE